MRPLCIFLLGLVCATSLPAIAFAHGGHGSALPIQACESSALGDACAYENEVHDVYRGTCRSIAGSLRCVRTQPIERPDPAAEPAQEHDVPLAPAPPKEHDVPLAPMTAGLFGLASAIAWVSRKRERDGA